jgi:hypothetical protein
MTMQAWAWEYVDSNGIAWRILGHTARRKKVYCIRGDEFAGAFDPDQPSLVEDGISRWPEVVRAKWREVIEAAQLNAALALSRKAVR